MAFRNPIRRLSQLVADTIIGALFETDVPPHRRVSIGPGDTAPADSTIRSAAAVRWYAENAGEVNPFAIYEQAGGAGVAFGQILGPQMSASKANAAIGLTGNTATDGGLIEFDAAFISFSNVGANSGAGADTAVQIGPGTPMAGLAYGSTQVTTNASALASIAHGLGAAPTIVVCQEQAASMFIRITSKGTVNFQVELHDAANALLPNTTRTIDWIAIR